MMESDQLGVFRVSAEMVRHQPYTVAIAFSILNLVPVRAEALYAQDCIEYTAISDRFAHVPQGNEPPRYELRITDDGNLLVEVELYMARFRE